MAHQDYVSRKANKKNNPYKGKQEAPAPSVPVKLKAVIFITLAAVLAFAYGLWKINHNNTNNAPTSDELATTTAQAKTEKTKLPEPPKEKWDYLEQLKTKEVEEGQYEVETKGPYKLQCGAFKTLKQAEVLKANIAFAGLESYIKVSQGTSSTWHQVYLGPYARKREAEKDKHRLRSNHIDYCKVLLWK